MRVIWTLVLLGVVWWLVRRWQVGRGSEGRSAETGADAPTGAPAQDVLPPARMVRCAHCGVHLPESDAFLSQGRHYCSTAHREAAERVA